MTKYRQRTATINQDTALVNLGSLDHSVKLLLEWVSQVSREESSLQEGSVQ